MFDDILGKDLPTCLQCGCEMKEYDSDHLVCPNGCWEFHGDWRSNDGVWRVGIGY